VKKPDMKAESDFHLDDVQKSQRHRGGEQIDPWLLEDGAQGDREGFSTSGNEGMFVKIVYWARYCSAHL
jgi:hypothetical protein